jgi:hypothetical protein
MLLGVKEFEVIKDGVLYTHEIDLYDNALSVV